MPEVGLERDSKPWHCWEVSETGGIRGVRWLYEAIRGGSVDIVHTSILAVFEHPTQGPDTIAAPVCGACKCAPPSSR